MEKILNVYLIQLKSSFKEISCIKIIVFLSLGHQMHVQFEPSLEFSLGEFLGSLIVGFTLEGGGEPRQLPNLSSRLDRENPLDCFWCHQDYAFRHRK